MSARIPKEFIVDFVAKKICNEKYTLLKNKAFEVKDCCMGEGLFLKENVKKGTVLMSFDDLKIKKMNDPLFQYLNVLNADSPDTMTNALFNARDCYYNSLEAYEKINVVLGANNSGMVYVATKDIAADEQLFRVYGFEAWLFELWDCLTIDNVEGYQAFLTYVLEEEKVNIETIKKDITNEMDLFRKWGYLWKIYKMNALLHIILQESLSNKITETLNNILIQLGIDYEASDIFAQKLKKAFESDCQNTIFLMEFTGSLPTLAYSPLYSYLIGKKCREKNITKEKTYFLTGLFFSLIILSFYMAY